MPRGRKPARRVTADQVIGIRAKYPSSASNMAPGRWPQFVAAVFMLFFRYQGRHAPLQPGYGVPELVPAQGSLAQAVHFAKSPGLRRTEYPPAVCQATTTSRWQVGNLWREPCRARRRVSGWAAPAAPAHRPTGVLQDDLPRILNLPFGRAVGAFKFRPLREILKRRSSSIDNSASNRGGAMTAG